MAPKTTDEDSGQVHDEPCKTTICQRARGFAVNVLITVAFLVSTSCTSSRAQSEGVSSPSIRSPNAKLVFMLTTGFQDLREMQLCLEDIKAAKASGYAEDVIWLVRGRGLGALGKPMGVLTRPPVIVRLAREVKAAGVPIIVSTDELKEQGMSIANLDLKPTKVLDDSAALMAELASMSYQIIRY